jgi:hypothetical protein
LGKCPKDTFSFVAVGDIALFRLAGVDYKELFTVSMPKAIPYVRVYIPRSGKS